MKKYIAIASLFLGMQAQAGFLATPYLGYDMGTYTIKDLSGTDTSGKATSTSFGAMLGWKFGNGMWLAADILSGSGKLKRDAGGTDSDLTRSAMGVDLGFDRGWFTGYLGYNTSDVVTGKDDSGEGKYKGTSMAVGLGAKIANHFSLMLKYTTYSFKDIESGGVNYTLADFYPTFSTADTSVVLAFPFDFGK